MNHYTCLPTDLITSAPQSTPVLLAVNDELYADSCEDYSLWCTPECYKLGLILHILECAITVKEFT